MSVILFFVVKIILSFYSKQPNYSCYWKIQGTCGSLDFHISPLNLITDVEGSRILNHLRVAALSFRIVTVCFALDWQNVLKHFVTLADIHIFPINSDLPAAYAVNFRLNNASANDMWVLHVISASVHNAVQIMFVPQTSKCDFRSKFTLSTGM